MKKRILSTVFGIWLALLTLMPANVTLATTVGNGLQLRTPDVQCQNGTVKPGEPVVPCVKPNNVSWNS